MNSTVTIKNVITGAVIFSVDLPAYENQSDLQSIAVLNAVTAGVDLRYADLSGLDLRQSAINHGGHTSFIGAKFTGTQLHYSALNSIQFSGADLVGAIIGDDIVINKQPVFLSGSGVDVVILENHIKINSAFCSVEEWATFDQNVLENVSITVLKFWDAYGDAILNIHRVNFNAVE